MTEIATDELKVGDLIATDPRYGVGTPDFHRVVRVTPTTYVCDHLRFRKSNLVIIGHDRFGPYQGRVPTKTDLIRRRISDASSLLKQLRVTESNLSSVEALLKIQKKGSPND